MITDILNNSLQSLSDAFSKGFFWAEREKRSRLGMIERLFRALVGGCFGFFTVDEVCKERSDFALRAALGECRRKTVMKKPLVRDCLQAQASSLDPLMIKVSELVWRYLPLPENRSSPTTPVSDIQKNETLDLPSDRDPSSGSDISDEEQLQAGEQSPKEMDPQGIGSPIALSNLIDGNQLTDKEKEIALFILTEICDKTFGCGLIDKGILISKVLRKYGTDVHPQCALVLVWEWLLKEQLSLMKSLKKESQKWEFFLKNFIQEKTAPDDCGNVVILLQDLLKNRLLKREQLERIYTKNDHLVSSEQKWLQEVFACLVEELPLL
ncbi:MAG: hypothetical protein A3I15_02550 [Chlamydiae bacterium RIFCSPLOWO2_02_FULL_49_12]|nr:MAG: hypothetical protein A3I15_02550 [Chlamydiae bacterium RIFCSPLOWO2_02_FULL_49_12]